MIYQSVRYWSIYNGHRTRPITSLLSTTFCPINLNARNASHQKRAYKVLFFGSDHFSIPSLQALHENSNTLRSDESNPVDELAAVTSFKGTDNAVRKFIKTTGFPTHSWPLNDPVELCKRFDVGVVVSFGYLIPEQIIEAFPLGMINVHASLLPRWRGAAPIIHALRNGDTQTGVTIMRIRPRHFDVGEVLAQKAVSIGADTLMPQLHAELAALGADLLVKTMHTLEESLREARQQDDTSVQYAPKVTDELAQVDWHTMTALQVYNLYRALYSFKRLTTSWHGESIRIVELAPLSSAAVDSIATKPPGTVEYCRVSRQLRAWCADGRFVSVTRLSVVGKRTFTAADFQNGYLRKVISTDARLARFV